MPLTKIISGGQTGADIAALRAARACNPPLQTGGHCPRCYMTASGPNPELASFGLTQVNDGPLSQQYVLRSQLNVSAADATLAFRFKPSVGTDKTIAFATTGQWSPLKATPVAGPMPSKKKPVFVVTDMSTPGLTDQIVAFLKQQHVTTLNVCGHRDECYEHDITVFLLDIFHKI